MTTPTPTSGPFARIAVLENENEIMRERIRQLEATLTEDWTPPIVLGLTAKESFFVAALRSRERVTRDLIMNELYGDKTDEETPDVKIVDVFVCKLRKKLKPHGVEVLTLRGQGYALAPGAKELLDALKGPAADPTEKAA